MEAFLLEQKSAFCADVFDSPWTACEQPPQVMGFYGYAVFLLYPLGNNANITFVVGCCSGQSNGNGFASKRG